LGLGVEAVKEGRQGPKAWLAGAFEENGDDFALMLGLYVEGTGHEGLVCSQVVVVLQDVQYSRALPHRHHLQIDRVGASARQGQWV
jgi:hypothetical protein